jgi:hypothetical protein
MTVFNERHRLARSLGVAHSMVGSGGRFYALGDGPFHPGCSRRRPPLIFSQGQSKKESSGQIGNAFPISSKRGNQSAAVAEFLQNG